MKNIVQKSLISLSVFNICLLLALILTGCGEAEATSKNNVVNKVIKPRIVEEPVTDYKDYTVVAEQPVEVDIDDMTFTEAFGIQHKAKGEGHTFWWRGEEYTTDLAVVDEFVLDHLIFGINVVNTDRMGWVTNNDDPDDNCTSNILDDCGILDIVKEKYTFNILRKMCKKNGITAYRNKSKKELIRLLIGL